MKKYILLARSHLDEMPRITPALIIAFPILIAIDTLTYFLLSIWADLVFCILVPLYAVFATVLASRLFRRDNSIRSRLLFGLTAFTWILWVVLPIQRLGGLARLYFEMPAYEASIEKDEPPVLQPCADSDGCWSGTYRYFPYTSGFFLVPTLGVVRTPGRTSNLDEQALQDQLGPVTCDSEPLAKGYYWCSMQ